MSVRKILASLTVACCLIAAVSAALFFQHAQNLALSNAQQDVDRTSRLLAAEFETYLQEHTRAVALLAGVPQLENQLRDNSELNSHKTTGILNLSCESLKGALCYLMDVNGAVVASDTHPSSPTITGNNYAFRPYFTQALEQGKGIYMALGVTTRKLGIYFSNVVRSADDQPLGVAVVKFSPEGIEDKFSVNRGDSVLIDENGVVFASTQSDWLLHSLWKLSPQQPSELTKSRQFADQSPLSL